MKQKQQFGTGEVLLLIIIAYIFSFAIRMIWVYQFQDNPDFLWNDELMINTNDGYFFASGAQKELFGMHLENARIPSVWSFGTVAITVFLTKIMPFSLETVVLYMPAIISSLVVVPIILISRLFNLTLWGFLSALLGAIAWSYYNRTMMGYYDTDMFSAMAPMFILYFLMKSTMDFTLKSALYAAIAIAIYPFLYDGGASIVFAMGILYAAYMIFYHRDDATTYNSIILVFLALVPFPFADPYAYIIKIAVLVVLSVELRNHTLGHKNSIISIGILFLLFMYFGNVFGLILSKVAFYTSTGTADTGLHFYSVSQTIREAGKIPFETFANRISGSQLGVILSSLGYIFLVLRHKVFILALPLIGIGAFALSGGLRFTVYAVPVAAMAMVYLFYYMATVDKQKVAIVYGSIIISFWFFIEQTVTLVIPFMPEVNGSSIGEKMSIFSNALDQVLKDTWVSFLDIFEHGLRSDRVEFYDIIIGVLFLSIFLILALVLKGKQYKSKTSIYMALLTILFLVPNITHIIGYKVSTVLTKAEVEDLKKLDNIATSKDYTLTWWDYGYPVWFYSDTNTIIDGGKHQNDNFIISKIMQTTSPELAANLSRLAVETYVDSNYSNIANTIFKNGKEDQLDPNLLLAELESDMYTLPDKTRDIYLYLPYRMLRIFPTVAVFGNMDLNTGIAERRMVFYPSNAVNKKNGVISFSNGIKFDIENGVVILGNQRAKVKNFIITQNTLQGHVQLQSKLYHADGGYAIVYMKSNNIFVVMDIETFNSMYVQMFILEKYDKKRFELVVSSHHSKIYKLK